VRLQAGLNMRKFRYPSRLAGLAESNFRACLLECSSGYEQRGRWQPLVLHDLGLTPNQGWNPTESGRAVLEAALTAMLRDDFSTAHMPHLGPGYVCKKNGGSISGRRMARCRG
jgi:hypothetical protein